MSLKDRIRYAANPEPRCPAVLLLDTSSSMEGAPINELNKGIAVFKENILKDNTAKKRVEIAVITFGDEPKLIHDFSSIKDFEPPQLETRGFTPMGQAIELAIEMVANQKSIYKSHGISYYQPWLFLISDGEPTDDYSNAAKQVRKAAAESKLCFYAVAVKT